MRLTHPLLACLLTLLSAAPYAKAPVVERALSADAYTTLREAYGAREDFDAVCGNNALSRQIEANRATTDYAEALRVINLHLAACPVDIMALLGRAASLKKLQNADAYAVANANLHAILQSIARSGDGRTPATAFKVISIPEEYAFLQLSGVRVIDQALISTPVARDVFTVADSKGNTTKVYFYPEAHFKRLARKLQTPLPVQATQAPAGPAATSAAAQASPVTATLPNEPVALYLHFVAASTAHLECRRTQRNYTNFLLAGLQAERALMQQYSQQSAEQARTELDMRSERTRNATLARIAQQSCTGAEVDALANSFESLSKMSANAFKSIAP